MGYCVRAKSATERYRRVPTRSAKRTITSTSKRVNDGEKRKKNKAIIPFLPRISEVAPKLNSLETDLATSIVARLPCFISERRCFANRNRKLRTRA